MGLWGCVVSERARVRVCVSARGVRTCVVLRHTPPAAAGRSVAFVCVCVCVCVVGRMHPAQQRFLIVGMDPMTENTNSSNNQLRSPR